MKKPTLVSSQEGSQIPLYPSLAKWGKDLIPQFHKFVGKD